MKPNKGERVASQVSLAQNVIGKGRREGTMFHTAMGEGGREREVIVEKARSYA